MANATDRKLAGVLGFYNNPTELIEAMKKLRAANYRSFDAFTPYPVHGLDAAQGLKRSPLPYVTFGAGLTGFCTALTYQYWTSAVDWPLIVGGKPFFSWPAFVPVMFELTVLFGGLATVGAMFLINGLPNTSRKIFDPSLTRDRFALFIEHPGEDDSDDPKAGQYKKFDESEAQSFLKSIGASDVRSVYAEGWF